MPTYTRLRIPGFSVAEGLPELGQIWTPDSLGPALKAWWSSDDETLFTFDGATNSITGWASKEGGLVLAPPSGATKPTRAVAGWGEGSPGVVFAGNADATPGDMLACAPAAVLTTMVVMMLVKRGTQSDDATQSTRTVGMFPIIPQTPVTNGMIATFGFQRPTVDPGQTKVFSGGIGSGAGSNSINQPWASGEKVVIAADISGSGVSTQIDAGTTSAVGGLGASVTNLWQIGGHVANKKAAAMTVKEIVVVDAFASSALRQKAEGYLAWRGGIQDKLPAGHPYREDFPAA